MDSTKSDNPTITTTISYGSIGVTKRKAKGVLGEMLKNIDPDSLERTKQQMLKQIMTKEEKAKELAQICFPDELNIWARGNVEAKKVELSCIAMYNWTVENVCKWLENNLHNDRRNDETLVNVGGLWANYANIDELIDALKKEI